MNCQKLVCPYDASLLDRIRDHTLVVRVADPALIQVAAAHVRQAGNRLLCVIFESQQPMSAVQPAEEWKGIPIALMVPSLGQFRDLAGSIAQFAGLNLRVYVPWSKENLTGVRILASLGVATCLDFDDPGVDWEELADLMTYALLGVVPHAPIEPFAHIARNYDPSSYAQWRSVYFDNPRQFLHLDAAGRVALTPADLDRGAFMAGDVGDLLAPGSGGAATGIAVPPERLEGWRELFLNRHSCAACQGWRVCLGRYADRAADNPGCADFFSELMTVCQVRRQKLAEEEGRHAWQL